MIACCVSWRITAAADATFAAATDPVPDWSALISNAVQAAAQTLQRHEQLAAMQMPDDVHSVSETLSTLTESAKVNERLRQERDALIGQVNAKQLQELMKMLDRISVAAVEQQARREDQENSNDNNETTIQDVQRMFAVPKVLSESESDLETWILQLIRQEIDTWTQTNGAAAFEKANRHSDASSSSCLTTERAMRHVQEALQRHVQDGIGRIDYAAAGAANGGKIVHQLTSPTYRMGTGDSSFPQQQQQPTLGSVWWNKYIPQDWEQWLLPSGWQTWKVASSIVPDHVYHTLGVSTAASTAPPEAVLQASVLPGQCWPVGMLQQQQPNGEPAAMITIALATPVAVNAITVDHVSRLLLFRPEEQLRSAPKTLKIYGYAPCHATETQCSSGLGFNVNSKALLTEITYDIHGESNVQTFEITGSNMAEREVKEHAASCSADKPGTCIEGGGGISTVVAAVGVGIVENWGNKDYTCLYRIRIHGEPEAF